MTSIVKPEPDYKNYRYIVLPNGLRAMLISNVKPGEQVDDCVADVSEEETQEENGESSDEESALRKSAAALCVSVGSFSDPREAQGLAHFLEHMVFMGSEKYPRENDFDDYVIHRGGHNNAFTNGDCTTFYFGIQRSSFRDALDKFANFFVAPLLNKNCVDRELEAVHSEFELAKSEDGSRFIQLVASLAKEDSPCHIFGWGNRISLRDNSEASGTNVYQMLKNFQQKYYNARLMTLAVESQDSLNNLETMVRQIFSSIPDRSSEFPNLSPFINPFPDSVFKKLIKVCPVMDTVKINLVWSLPPMHKHYRSGALRFVGALIGYEGEGSLMSLLRKRNLATELEAGCPSEDSTYNNDMTSIFSISIELADVGRKSPFEVFDLTYSYLRMLREAAAAVSTCSGTEFEELVSQYAQLWRTSFRFQEPMQPVTNVEWVATALRRFPPQEVFTTDSLIQEPDLSAYVNIVSLLRPEKAMTFLTLPEFNAEAAADVKQEVFLREPWFDIRYSMTELSEEQILKWANAPLLPELHLPKKNVFITTNFDLLPVSEDDEVPHQVDLGELTAFGELWHLQRTKYNVPRAEVYLRLSSDGVQTPKDYACLLLWTEALNKHLQTLLYPASEAGLNFNVTHDECNFDISVNGFNEKLLLVFQEVLKALSKSVISENEEGIFSEKSFGTYRDTSRQTVTNRILNPSTLSVHVTRYLTREDTTLCENTMQALRDLSLSDMIIFVRRFLARFRAKLFVFGNINAKESVRYFESIVSTLNPSEVAVLEPYRKAALPACLHRVRVMNYNPTDVNTALILTVPLAGTPSADLRMEALNKLLVSCLSEPAFAYLRTKETLGYSVGLRSFCQRDSTQEAGVQVVVRSQANKFPIDFVAGRIYAFWYRIAPAIIAHLRQDAFDTCLESLISKYQLEDHTMNEEGYRHFREVFSQRPFFDRRKRYVQILGETELKDLQEFFEQNYHNANRPSLMIQVDSRGVEGASSLQQGASVDLTSFEWPLALVPVTEAQVAAELAAATSVDLADAIRACAPELAAADAAVNGGGEAGSDSGLPKVVEIGDLEDFKHRVLFPRSA